MQMMKSALCLAAMFAALPTGQAATVAVSPIEKVVQMLSDLASKVITEGEDSHKVFAEFSEWCEDRSKNLDFEIKTGKAQVADLSAAIDQENARQGELNAKIEELSGEIATDESDLKAATEIRAKEQADFQAEEAELVDIVDMLTRAVGILEKEMAKGGAAMLQLKQAHTITDAIRVLVQGSMLGSAEGTRLTALVQSYQSDSSDDSDSDLAVNAPAAAVYEGHSGDIIATLQDLLEKGESQLATARKKETNNVHNFEMLKQSLQDEIKFGTKDMDKSKKSLAESSEKEASAQGDLTVTTKELKTDIAAKADLHHLCLNKATDFESEQKSREEELKAIAQAKRAIVDATSGAASQQYGLGQVSLLQLAGHSSISSRSDLANFEAVRFVRDLARKLNAPALTQLASRMAYAMRFTSQSGDDPFAKIKGLISDMIAKLEDAAEADATEKAYCDKEISETNVKKEDKTEEIDKLSTKIDQMSARSEKLKEEVAGLQKSLADLMKSQGEMDKVRAEEKAAYKKNKAEMEQGLEGVKLALNILREYYAKDHDHAASEGAGGSIISLLEVVESDFSKTLAEMVATEENSQSEYDAQTKENEIEKTTKEQDVKYKTKEFTDLDKAVAEASADRSGVEAELNAVMEYMRSLEARCIAKPESYSDRKGRREAEIAGLKEALQILEGEASTVLLQHKTRRGLRIATSQ